MNRKPALIWNTPVEVVTADDGCGDITIEKEEDYDYLEPDPCAGNLETKLDAGPLYLADYTDLAGD